MLTNATIKAASASTRPYKMGDAGGLFLFVATSGRKTFRMKCRHETKEKLLTFGVYPDLSLAEARALRDGAREQLRLGVDPSGTRRRAIVAAAAALRITTDAPTFEPIARAWHALQVPRWSAVHAADVLVSLERDVFPAIGAMPIAGITVPVVLNALRGIEGRGCVETARRVRQRISAVFGFAIGEGFTQTDPAAIVTRALAPTPIAKHHPALLNIDAARGLLAAAELVDSAAIAKLASRFLALTAVRLAAVRGAKWDEFEDADWTGRFIGPTRPLWRVPAARMKMAKAKKVEAGANHLVPLSWQAVDVLRAARALVDDRVAGEARVVFPGRGGRAPIGEAAIGDLYDRAGYAGRHVPHGWRSTFSTLMNAADAEDADLIEVALAHAPKNKVKAAYDRGEYLAARRGLFQRWAEMLVPASS